MHHQQIIVPWRLIDGPESADGFAADIGRARYTRASRTSISGALLFAAPLFEGSGYRGVRRVIDVSGDGVNNNGPLVTVTRDEVLAKGITINGLPILLKRPNASTLDIEQLDIYYEDCVIGGPGRLRHPDQGARAVQGGDPHQAGAGDRRPHARAARRAGGGRRAAHLLHHRRAPVAGALGQLVLLHRPPCDEQRRTRPDRRRRHRRHGARHCAAARRDRGRDCRDRQGLAGLWRGHHHHRADACARSIGSACSMRW